MAKKPTTEGSPVAHFEQSLDELEQLVEKMEHGDLNLEQSLNAYERAWASTANASRPWNKPNCACACSAIRQPRRFRTV